MTTASERRRVFAEGPQVDRLRAFALSAWRARAAELGLPEPRDLSSSCKFGALLVRRLHGGEIRGGWEHVHCRLPDGRILDPSRFADDVEALRTRGRDPYVHDRAFVRSRDFRESLASCEARVARWAEEWMRTEQSMKETTA